MIDVRRTFPGGPSFRFELTIPAAGTTVLFGPSGSGKTTLLRMLAGLDAPDHGRIVVGGVTFFDSATRENVRPQDRRMGYVTQEPALFPHLTVADNTGFGVPASGRAARVAEMLDLVGLKDLGHRYPAELSGGQKQRVAIARAVASRPQILLLDEPLSSLDAAGRDSLRRDLGRFLRAFSIPALLVTHDRTEALSLGDHVALVGEGRVLQKGPIAEVFSRPASLEAARVVGIEAVVPGRITGRGTEGVVTLVVAGVTLTALDPGEGIELVFACIRADEVILEPGLSPSSARNRLKATVTTIQFESALVRVGLDCGFPLTAYITRAALRDLDLREGSKVSAVIKAPAVHLVSRNAG